MTYSVSRRRKYLRTSHATRFFLGEITVCDSSISLDANERQPPRVSARRAVKRARAGATADSVREGTRGAALVVARAVSTHAPLGARESPWSRLPSPRAARRVPARIRIPGGRARLGSRASTPRERGQSPPPPPRARTASSSTTPSAAALAAARDAAFEPVGWREYFDRALDIPVGDVDVFRVYTARDEGANDAAPASSASSASSVPIDTIVLCVHGCPCTRLSWAPAALRARAPPRPLARRRRRRPPMPGEDRCCERLTSSCAPLRRHLAALVALLLRIQKNRGRERTRTEASVRVSRGTQRGHCTAARAAYSSSTATKPSSPAAWSTPRGRSLAAIPRMEANLAAGVRPESFASNATPSRGRYARAVSRETWTPRASPSPRNSRARASAMTTPPKVFRVGVRVANVPSPRRGRTGAGGSKVYRARFLPRRVRNCWCWRASINWTTTRRRADVRKFQTVLFPGRGPRVHEDEPERVADAVAAFVRRYAGATRVGNGLYARTTR